MDDKLDDPVICDCVTVNKLNSKTQTIKQNSFYLFVLSQTKY